MCHRATPSYRGVRGIKLFLNKHILILNNMKFLLLRKREVNDKQLVLSAEALSTVLGTS